MPATVSNVRIFVDGVELTGFASTDVVTVERVEEPNEDEPDWWHNDISEIGCLNVYENIYHMARFEASK